MRGATRASFAFMITKRNPLVSIYRRNHVWPLPPRSNWEPIKNEVWISAEDVATVSEEVFPKVLSLFVCYSFNEGRHVVGRQKQKQFLLGDPCVAGARAKRGFDDVIENVRMKCSFHAMRNLHGACLALPEM